MKVFLAGHKGLVGSAILRKLKEKKYKNIIIADKKKLNLLDQKKVFEFLKKKKPDLVIIAAAKVGGIYHNNSKGADFIYENLQIQNNLIHGSFKNNIRNLIFLGSSCIYPKFSKQPIKEEYLLSDSLEPTNEWYATAKIAGIQLCRALRLQHNFDAISLMPTNLYGPGDNYHPSHSHVMAALIRRFSEAKVNHLNEVVCWGTGSPMREFLHVDDLADAAVFCLEHWQIKQPGNEPDILNVGTGRDISIKALASLLAQITGYQGKIIWDESKPDGTPRKLLNIEKLKSLGWEAQIDLEAGLKQVVSDYQSKMG